MTVNELITKLLECENKDLQVVFHVNLESESELADDCTVLDDDDFVTIEIEN